MEITVSVQPNPLAALTVGWAELCEAHRQATPTAVGLAKLGPPYISVT